MMAGLLDTLGEAGTFFVGDDKDKDEYGQTQADRRMPLWAGMIKAGLLGVAGGQRMMPEQRAQYIAQMGGALGGIPQDMVEARSNSAKQLLAQQGIVANRTKLANQAKIQAMGQTPEAQAALAKMEPAHRMAMQAAYDAGDIDKVVGILGIQDKTAVAHDRLVMQGQLNDAKMTAATAKLEAAGLGASPERVAHGYLLRAQTDAAFRATPQYKWALDFLNRDEKTATGGTVPKIDLTGYPEATFGQAPPQAPAPPVPPPVTTQVPPPPSVAPPGQQLPPFAAPPGTGGAPPLQAPGAPPGAAPPRGMPMPPPPQAAPSAAPAPPVAPPAPARPVLPPNATPAQHADALAPGSEATLPNGINVAKFADGTIEYEVPAVGNRAGQRYRREPGGKTETLAPLKPIPAPELNVLTTTTSTLKKLDALEQHLKNPKVELGTVGTYLLPNDALNRTNPEGIEARSIIASIAAKTVHDLSGAAVTDAEFKRLEAFIPKNTDNADTIRAKLKGMRRELEDIGKAHYQNLPENSRIPMEMHTRYGTAKASPYKTWNPVTQRAE